LYSVPLTPEAPSKTITVGYDLISKRWQSDSRDLNEPSGSGGWCTKRLQSTSAISTRSRSRYVVASLSHALRIVAQSPCPFAFGMAQMHHGEENSTKVIRASDLTTLSSKSSSSSMSEVPVCTQPAEAAPMCAHTQATRTALVVIAHPRQSR